MQKGSTWDGNWPPFTCEQNPNGQAEGAQSHAATSLQTLLVVNHNDYERRQNAFEQNFLQAVH